MTAPQGPPPGPQAQPQAPPPGQAPAPQAPPQPVAAQPQPQPQFQPPPPYQQQPPPGQAWGPPPGAQPPPGASSYAGYGYGPQPAAAPRTMPGPWLWLALLALVALLVGLSIKEDGSRGWGLEAWAGFAVVAALVVLTPLVRNALKLDERRAWTVAAIGFAGLALYWLLFVLPSISRNTSFLQTLAVGFAGLALWLAPGRPTPP